MAKSKYGDIPHDLVKAIGRRWSTGLLDGSGWPDCESWIRWAYANGYQRGYHLGKFDDQKPHGPNNSFFYASAEKLPEDKKAMARNLCRECDHPCPASGYGCAQWREWFVKNWNENICRKPKETPKQVKETRRVFRYEHPDLVREGKA